MTPTHSMPKTENATRRMLASFLAAVAVVALAFGLTACETAPSSSAAPASAEPASRQAPLPTTDVGPLRVPLPRGDWREVLTREGDFNDGRGKDHRKVMARVRDGVVDRLVLAHVVEANSGEAFRQPASCKRSTYYFQTITEELRGRGDCWHVRYVNFGLQNEPHWLSTEIDAYMLREQLAFPVVMLGVRFIRYDGPLLLQIEYLWNAELLLPPEGKPIWIPADWKNEAVRADLQRRVVMETLKEWGEDWHPDIARTIAF